MKIIHFLATMAISSLLGACNGGQYIVNGIRLTMLIHT